MDSTGFPISVTGSEPLSAVLLQLSSEGLQLASVRLPQQTRTTSFTDHAINTLDASSGLHPNVRFQSKIIDFSGSELQKNQENGIRPKYDTPVISHAASGLENTGSTSLVQKIQIQDSPKYTSFMKQHELQDQKLLNREELGQSSIFLEQHKNTNQNDCNKLLNSLKRRFNTKNQNDPHNLSCFLRNPIPYTQNQGSNGARPQQISPLSPMAHMNLQQQREKFKKVPEKQPVVEEQLKEGAVPEFNFTYKPGRGPERLNQFIFQLQNRPRDNNIEFWRNFVAEFFAPNATKRWCVSSYKKSKQLDSLFAKVVWHCDMCNVKPSCGFQISGELLPRLYKIKYETGLLEQRLQIGVPIESHCASGHIYLHYSKAFEESEYEQVRIVRYGQLRVVLSSDLKICSLEFCAQHHEEFIRRNCIIPQVYQLGAAVQNYQLSTEAASSVTPEELQKSSDMFVSSAHQMVEALGMPFISQIGIVKRFLRCLQISEVLNTMDVLIRYSQENGIGPTESMAKFLHFGFNVPPGEQNSDQQSEQQQAPAAPSAPHFPAFPVVGSETGFCANGFDNSSVFTVMRPNNKKKQRTDPNRSYSETPDQVTSLGFSNIAASHLKSPALIASTSSLSIQPHEADIIAVKLGESAAENLPQEPKTSISLQQACHLNLADPKTSPIIQEVLAVQPYNNIGIMPTGNNAHGNISGGGSSVASNAIMHINVENYEFKNKSVGCCAHDDGITPSGLMDMGGFFHNARANSLAKEFDDHLLDEFIDFDGLHELMN